MRHTISLFCILALFWLANSGIEHFTVLLLSIGLFSVVFVMFISHRMNLVDHESQPIHLTFRIPGYFLWLIKEIIIANFTVVRCIWSITPSISPTVITLKTNQKTALATVIYANSITLTPGTVTINLTNNELMVHALTKESAQSLYDGIMERRVLSLEK
ncbi:Na(+) H(+) antiporter subunit E [hydrothermal vent metagenome]|uniref:Na(+) H(+) antiporter subunit E n=1 Tax=hydrothermal vent metagenome TaxID=652676 RepID=A0A3B1AGW2_9ZZZZ